MENSQSSNKNDSMIKMLLLIIIVLLIGGGVYWLYGSWKSQNAVDKVTDAIVDAAKQSGVNANVKVDQGNQGVNAQIGNINISAGVAVKAPDNFPKDIPLYANGKIIAASSVSQIGSVTVTATTSDSIDTVSAYYKSAMLANGWSDTSSYASDNGQTQLYQKENRTATVGINSDGAGITTLILGVIEITIPTLGQ